ncbi:GNAT family N-acetyltransferase [Paenibacillus wynnii]|uniref:GNAT family N-acetyltransferase n=1 Tax=Paenibacillus wynnii TaxID=268407 RepID=UPI0027914BC2|nr:GNAT family N-acetyltransferase [Paenibacillus wynnii]MDQ0194532.1 RimJ/RimL family protein N-acetyltransferase [Paenibacillus wynnii]
MLEIKYAKFQKKGILGYMIVKKYRGQGYATEALQAMTQWIFNQPGSLYVLADTEKDNISGYR